jgi:Ca-activated chloride channel family protein
VCGDTQRRRFTGTVVFVCLVILTGGGALAVSAQRPTFKVDVQLVRLLATVKDPEGRVIGKLEKDDFLVYDNGVRQEVSVFERYTEQPLSVALLIDASGSTAKELKYELESSRRFLRSVIRGGNEQDAVALFTFNWVVRQHTTFTRRLDRLATEMASIKPEGGTSMYDALYLSAQELEVREGRRVLVIVTDGGDTTSSKTFHQGLEALHRADTVLYAIVVMPITNDAGRNIGGENALTTLAQSTGGRVFTPADAAALDSAFDEIILDLRTQYLIAYYPKNVGASKDPFHKVELKATGTGLKVTTRTGYFGQGDATQ